MISCAFLVPLAGSRVALELFAQAASPTSSIPCDLITVNTVLRHYARAADVQAMNSLFSLAANLKLKPDIITFTTLVQGLLRADEIDMAKRALTAMHSLGVVANERMYSMLIADLAKSGSRQGLKNAEEMMATMKPSGLKAGIVTWTGLISGYFKGGWVDDGWDAIRRMGETGLKLNRVGYNVVLRQAQERAEVGLPVRLLRKMVSDGARPNGDTWAIVLGPMVKGKRWDEAKQVVGEMDKLGFRPETTALRGLVGRVREAR
jgi:pentatricopeptide repeat protein